MTQGYFDTGLFRMGLFWFGVILAWGYFGLGLFWFGVIMVWGYFGGVISVGLFWFGVISYCSPVSHSLNYLIIFACQRIICYDTWVFSKVDGGSGYFLRTPFLISCYSH